MMVLSENISTYRFVHLLYITKRHLLPWTVGEHFNSRLKEEFGGRDVMVRGASKVMLHLMFGVISIFDDHLLKLEEC